MKRLFFLMCLAAIALSGFAQSKKEMQVQAAVSELVKAMIDGNESELRKIADDRLSYGHSGGHVEGKEEFVQKFKTGQSDFVTIDITGQQIILHKKTAIVRHHLEAKTNDNNKPGNVALDVMTVWQKKAGKWKLIARQAVKPH